MSTKKHTTMVRLTLEPEESKQLKLIVVERDTNVSELFTRYARWVIRHYGKNKSILSVGDSDDPQNNA